MRKYLLLILILFIAGCASQEEQLAGSATTTNFIGSNVASTTGGEPIIKKDSASKIALDWLRKEYTTNAKKYEPLAGESPYSVMEDTLAIGYNTFFSPSGKVWEVETDGKVSLKPYGITLFGRGTVFVDDKTGVVLNFSRYFDPVGAKTLSIINGGFESDLDGWESVKHGNEAYLSENIISEAHSGSKSLFLNDSEIAAYGVYIARCQKFPVVEGKAYLARGWVKVKGGAVQFFLTTGENNQCENVPNSGYADELTNSEWKEYVRSCTTAGVSEMMVCVGTQYGPNSGYALFDDISLMS